MDRIVAALFWCVAALAFLVAALAFCVAAKTTPRLFYNPSASAPVGLYWLTQQPGGRGDLVLVWPPDRVKTLAATRQYLPAGVPLIKRIAGIAGDEICALDDEILVNGTVLAARLDRDSKDRPMPKWHGCHVLADEVFVLMTEVTTSFDGRYFGAVPRASVAGKLIPVWTQ